MRSPTTFALALVSVCAIAGCGGAATPASAGDAAVATDAPSPIATLCANARRLGCGRASMCEQEVSAFLAGVPSACATQRDAFVQCAARATATGCLSNDATFAMCAAQNDALARCAGPIDAGGPADAPRAPDVPGMEDAGAPDVAIAPADVTTDDAAPPADAGEACPALSGTYDGTGGGGLTVCPSGTFTLTRAPGATCRYIVSFAVSTTDAFTMSGAFFQVMSDLSLTGEASVTDATGTRMATFRGTFVEMGIGALVTLVRGTDECGWTLERRP
ncbi:MAG: hypothetical protein U0325_03205 [Polyangiales bacterium]